MRRILKTLAVAAFALGWCYCVMQVAMPEELFNMKTAVASLFRDYSVPYEVEPGFYLIEDQNVPLTSTDAIGMLEHNGWLKTKDGLLVNERDEPVQLRGMSSHGLAWYPEYTGVDAIRTTKDYGANLFRVAMYVDDMYGNYAHSEESQLNNKANMYAAIDSALSLDMYAIADWHVRKDGNPLYQLDNAMEFFDELSKHYADNPGVIYEISSDPNGDTTWDDIYEYADHVIPVIRKNAPNALIIAGTLEYSSDLSSTLLKPIPYSNVLYAYHYNSGIHKASYIDMLGAAAKAKLPIMTTWALGGGDVSYDAAQRYAMDFVSYVQENGISWAAWSLANKDESFSAIKPEVEKLSGWTSEDLTVSGKIAFSALGKP